MCFIPANTCFNSDIDYQEKPGGDANSGALYRPSVCSKYVVLQASVSCGSIQNKHKAKTPARQNVDYFWGFMLKKRRILETRFVGEYNNRTRLRLPSKTLERGGFIVDYPMSVLKPRSENPQETRGFAKPDSPVAVMKADRLITTAPPQPTNYCFFTYQSSSASSYRAPGPSSRTQRERQQ